MACCWSAIWLTFLPATTLKVFEGRRLVCIRLFTVSHHSISMAGRLICPALLGTIARLSVRTPSMPRLVCFSSNFGWSGYSFSSVFSKLGKGCICAEVNPSALMLMVLVIGSPAVNVPELSLHDCSNLTWLLGIHWLALRWAGMGAISTVFSSVSLITRLPLEKNPPNPELLVSNAVNRWLGTLSLPTDWPNRANLISIIE